MHAFIGVSKIESVWTWLSSCGANRLKRVYWCCDALYRRGERLSDNCSVRSKDGSCRSVGQRRHGVFTLHEVTENTHTHMPTAYLYIWMPHVTHEALTSSICSGGVRCQNLCALLFPFAVQIILWASCHSLRSHLLPQMSGALPGPQPQLPSVQRESVWGTLNFVGSNMQKVLKVVTFMRFLSASRLSNLRSCCSQFILL